MANFNIISSQPSQVFHVKRDINGVAHNCAHQALRQCLTQPIFCLSSAHSSIGCLTIAVLQNFTSQDYVINVVLCN
jgi:hypothetical protein